MHSIVYTCLAHYIVKTQIHFDQNLINNIQFFYMYCKHGPFLF